MSISAKQTCPPSNCTDRPYYRNAIITNSDIKTDTIIYTYSFFAGFHRNLATGQSWDNNCGCTENSNSSQLAILIQNSQDRWCNYTIYSYSEPVCVTGKFDSKNLTCDCPANYFGQYCSLSFSNCPIYSDSMAYSDTCRADGSGQLCTCAQGYPAPYRFPSLNFIEGVTLKPKIESEATRINVFEVLTFRFRFIGKNSVLKFNLKIDATIIYR